MIPAIRMIVFDWDGTVVDSIHGIALAMQQTAADLSLTVPSDEDARHVIGLGMHAALGYALPDLLAERVPEFLARYRQRYLALGPIDRPFDGIAGLLDELARRGYRLAVATGKSRIGLDRAFAATGYGPRFELSRCADEGRPKPDPWMLESIAGHTGLSPEAIAMIGDTSHDIAMAKAAGAFSVGVAWGAHPLAALERAAPGRLVHTVTELAALFGGVLNSGS